MPDQDPEELAWINTNLRPIERHDDGTSDWYVSSVVPPGFKRYLRLFNRWEDAEGGWTTWKERADAAGVVYHAELSECAIARVVSNRFMPTPWSTIATGDIDQISRETLCAILDLQTAGRPVTMVFTISEWVYAEPAVVVDLPLTRLAEGVYDTARGSPRGPGPEYTWPQDRDWIVYTGYDNSCSYIACDDELAEQLMASDGLEIVPTRLDARTDNRQDRVNCGPTGRRTPPDRPVKAVS